MVQVGQPGQNRILLSGAFQSPQRARRSGDEPPAEDSRRAVPASLAGRSNTVLSQCVRHCVDDVVQCCRQLAAKSRQKNDHFKSIEDLREAGAFMFPVGRLIAPSRRERPIVRAAPRRRA